VSGVRLALDGVLERVAAVDAEFAGMESQSQDVGVVADLVEQKLGGIVARFPALIAWKG